jgi:hypothetical protein
MMSSFFLNMEGRWILDKRIPKICERAKQLTALLQTETQVRRRERLQMLYWLKTGVVKTRQAVACLVCRHRETIGEWLATYEQYGLEGLLELKTHANRSWCLSPGELEHLQLT